jgi:hypothetical protein
MADISVNESIALLDSPASYVVGASDSIVSWTPLYKELVANADQTPFYINASVGSTTTGCSTILAAQGAGTYIILRRLEIIAADATIVRIGYGESGGWVQHMIWGPLNFNTQATAAGFKIGSQYNRKFGQLFRLPSNTALTVDVSAIAAVVVTAEGLIANN